MKKRHCLRKIFLLSPALPLLAALLAALVSGCGESREENRDKALHALDVTEARHKEGTLDTARSLIQPALDFFVPSDDDRNAARALYYAGIIESNAGRFGDAIVCQLKAEKRAAATDDLLLRGLIARSTADSYYSLLETGSALEYFNKAHTLFARLDSFPYTGYSLLDLARVHNAMGAPRRSLSYIEKTRKLARLHRDTVLEADAYLLSAKNRYDLHDLKGATSDYETAAGLHPQPMDPADIQRYGIALINSGRSEEGAMLLKALKEAGLPQYDYRILEYNLLRARGDVKGALEALELATGSQNNTLDSLLLRDYAVRIESHYRLTEERDAETIRSQRLMMAMTAIAAALILLIIYTVHVMRRKAIENRLRDVELVSRELERTATRTRNELRAAEKRNDALNVELGAAIESLSGAESRNRKLSDELSTLRTAGGGRDPLVRILDGMLGGIYERSGSIFSNAPRARGKFMDAIRSYGIAGLLERRAETELEELRPGSTAALEGLTAKERQILMLLVAGAGIRTVCLLLEITESTFYTHRHRIKEKFALLDPETARLLNALLEQREPETTE